MSEKQEMIVQEMPVEALRGAPYNQRKKFDKEKLGELAESIRQHGILQPLTVRPLEGETVFEIVAGERRWRAGKKAGLTTVPVVVKMLNEREAREVCILENLQREGLDVIEEAEGFAELVGMGMTVREVARRVGVKESYVYQRIRLVRLPEAAKAAIAAGEIHARTGDLLLQVEEPMRERALARILPDGSGRVMGMEEAAGVIRKEFVEPARLAGLWEDQKEELMAQYAGVEWMEYAAALKAAAWDSGLEYAMGRPDGSFLDPHGVANSAEPVPTWFELAKKHGARLVMGCKGGQAMEPAVMVDPGPVVDAERAVRAAAAEACIFGPVPGEREEAQAEVEHREEQLGIQRARRAEREAQEGRRREMQAVMADILNGTMSKKREKALAMWLLDVCAADLEGFAEHFPGAPEDLGGGEVRDWILKEGGRMIRKEAAPLLALGRILAADEVSRYEGAAGAAVVCGVLGVPERAAPGHYAVWEKGGPGVG